MTHFLSELEKGGGNAIDTFLWTGAALAVADMILYPQLAELVNDDSGLKHLALQTACVTAANTLVEYGRQKELLPVIFGQRTLK